MRRGVDGRAHRRRAPRGGSPRWRGPTTAGPAWRSPTAGPATCLRLWAMPAQVRHSRGFVTCCNAVNAELKADLSCRHNTMPLRYEAHSRSICYCGSTYHHAIEHAQMSQ
jgi:hypothetical protein